MPASVQVPAAEAAKMLKRASMREARDKQQAINLCQTTAVHCALATLGFEASVDVSAQACAASNITHAVWQKSHDPERYVPPSILC